MLLPLESIGKKISGLSRRGGSYSLRHTLAETYVGDMQVATHVIVENRSNGGSHEIGYFNTHYVPVRGRKPDHLVAGFWLKEGQRGKHASLERLLRGLGGKRIAGRTTP